MPVEISSPEHIKSLLDEQFGNDWLMWEPEVLWDELGRRMSISRADKDQIMAIRVMLKSDAPWKDWGAFLSVVRALNGIEISPIYANFSTPAQIAWALEVMDRFSLDDDFDPSIGQVVAGILYQDGIYWLPEGKMKDLAEPYLTDICYKKHGSEIEDIRNAAEQAYSLPDSEKPPQELKEHTSKLRLIEEYVERRRNG